MSLKGRTWLGGGESSIDLGDYMGIITISTIPKCLVLVIYALEYVNSPENIGP